ncbi:MAG: UDP-N-acetylglucosamine 2-epimerase (non-hydrolyzing) [Xanthomonadales bacterium]|jgi:UDP-N-acetylglucosamine 2-epimerase (non-hydrolysing)|nr:UDP-N-acetylglucosamine 2-epimerase (non-hydrolyzing) [Xanthomonadales bacterium]
MNSSSPKVLSVFGTRPEIIKFGPVQDALKRNSAITPVNLFTHQHQHIARPFLEQSGHEIHHELEALPGGQSLNAMHARLLAGLGQVLEREQPDCVLVQGDTASALAGAMAAFNLKIPVGHIEAGLRSGDVHSPFPEEMNRVLIDRMASLHFAATAHNRRNLLDEGAARDSVFVTGNTVVDALEKILAQKTESTACRELLHRTANTRRILLTAHRRENFSGRMAVYFSELRDFVTRHPDVSLIYPTHPNPEVLRIRNEYLGRHERLVLIEPLPYPDFVHLMSESWLIASDSGGVQEEAPGLRKPLLILRNTTERPESIECGVAKLVGAGPGRLTELLEAAYGSADWEARIQQVRNPFGDGHSGQRIADHTAAFLGA